jgi:hypothetical protein
MTVRRASGLVLADNTATAWWTRKVQEQLAFIEGASGVVVFLLHCQSVPEFLKMIVPGFTRHIPSVAFGPKLIAISQLLHINIPPLTIQYRRPSVFLSYAFSKAAGM